MLKKECNLTYKTVLKDSQTSFNNLSLYSIIPPVI